MIRAATLADAPAIARVHVQAWNETYRGILPDHALDVMTLEKRVEEWQQSLVQAQSWTFVHEDGGAVDAFTSAYRKSDEPGFDALLSTLYVLRSAQGKGVARQLLRRLARELAANGVHGLWLLTLRDRNPARGFYERLGAVLVREQPAPAILGEGTIDAVYAFPDLRVLRD